MNSENSKWMRIVNFKKGFPSNDELLQASVFSGFSGVENIAEGRVYLVKGLLKSELEEIKYSLFCNGLTDIILEEYYPLSLGKPLEIAFFQGVMDPVAVTMEKILSDYFKKEVEIKTRKLFLVKGDFDKKMLVQKVLSNPIIEEEIQVGSLPEEISKFHRTVVNRFNISDKTSKELLKLSKNMVLSLNTEEMIAIQEYYSGLKRSPTDAEIETIAQTWSEHCVHKTLKGVFNFEGEVIDDLFKSTIVEATKKIQREDCVSVFKDNAGIVSIDGEMAYCVKVETHNHPSALEPYGGAGTGLGGVVRDILGTGLGAKPVAGMDVFCTGDPWNNTDSLPEGTLHPRRILQGVVSGVRDYGNRIGVPTLSGAIVVDQGFMCNPLVFAGCIGLLPVKDAEKRVIPGDRIVLIGGKTGRDGLHGATFSSVTLDTNSEKKSQGSVQIGNPIEEKKIIEAVLRIREEGLLNAVTDCGAGGLSSAVGEMGAQTGALARLENVPLKYEYISPWEIWLSESQERMVMAVPLENIDRVFEICEQEETNVSVIGEFTDTQKLEVFYYDEKIVNLDMKFLHEGVPRRHIHAKRKFSHEQKCVKEKPCVEKTILKLLSLPDIASKDWIVRQYDHQVQGKTVNGPFSGKAQKSHSDGCSFSVDYGMDHEIAMGLGINVQFGKYDCFRMATFSVEEALRNLVCAGGNPKKAVLLDNFSWGSSEDPEAMGDLVLACRACHDSSLAYRTPFISGKDSLNNTYKVKDKTVSIPPTLLITAVAVKDRKTPLNVFSSEGDSVFLIGPDPKGLKGGALERITGPLGSSLPDIDFELSREVIGWIHDNLEKFSSIHDVSDGGLAVCLSEMAIGSNLGVFIKIPKETDEIEYLFSESPSRFVVTIKENSEMNFLNGIKATKLGVVEKKPVLTILGSSSEIQIGVDEMEKAYFSKRL
ncbi:phosphoribosylformylglycinamidine synthase subunit PurL [candidate division WOR-3 bacterium]|nr:phosphoribosylformylglycinamidine synthase subunit PurL [candidate division WOR-3 bacterium]